MKSMARATLLAIAVMLMSGAALAQGPARGPIEPPRDETLEIGAKHNLTVARYYLEKRKAYKGALDRLQEIVDAYADFSRMDEVLFLMGEANYKLNQMDKAGAFYNKMLKAYPNSEFNKRARERLVELKIAPETPDAADVKKPAADKKP
jgi:tetratricopeptide (TPR) repeat protein